MESVCQQKKKNEELGIQCLMENGTKSMTMHGKIEINEYNNNVKIHN